MEIKEREKAVKYAAIILDRLSGLFDEESEDFSINTKDFKNEASMAAFFHALGNLVPQYFLRKLSDPKTDLLDANHTLNSLLFRFGKVKEEAE